ncbi:tetratricopeptide repeat protein [Maribacter vaceletii]|uniref:Tetratricopeptide repeat protein n=1 Tax=Maribacter vaceletii TaxID=1206816 RepID=A0A495EC43_9FLAO|nr:tetratricopeptide repeat protein [Maribacter vaceletii]RKR14454.1 tetratricopeptide repeat protein [Maribacter vaceletii]
MRIFITFLLTCCFFWTSAQEDFLALQYFNDGEFDKAVVFYEKLSKSNPRRLDYLEGLVACYQQLERYEDAEAFLEKKIKDTNVAPNFIIDLGYTYSLQSKNEKAEAQYNKAIKFLSKNPNYGSRIGAKFLKYSLLNKAIIAYEKAMALNPSLNYNYQLARIYGEQGNIEKMYVAYLTLLLEGKTSKSNVLRNIDAFVTEETTNTNNLILKKVLLKNAQRNPDILWNDLLSWLFVKQKQYESAFRQEKAIFKRTEGTNTNRLIDLSDIAYNVGELDVAQEIYYFILKETQDETTRLDSELQLINIQLQQEGTSTLDNVEKKYKELLQIHGIKNTTLRLQIAYAKFLTFKKNTPDPAIKLLKDYLEIPLNRESVAYVKFALGEILVYNKKFNEALIYFSQIQRKFKNDVIGQNARFKVAQTSFYKGDFDWALTQLKVLRSSTSQLIANDAMQLSLLISDNVLEDSTQIALKKYARADLLAYQNKTKEAVTILNDILENHKGEKIEDEALLKQGEFLEQLKEYEQAKFNYQKIIEFYAQGILADDAYYALGMLYENKLNKPQKAKEQFEKIIYNYQDSYYAPTARKHFRRLRGDAIN